MACSPWMRHTSRLPLGPLLTAAGLEPLPAREAPVRDVRRGVDWCDYNATGRPPGTSGQRGMDYVAEQVGVTARTLHRSAHDGLSPRQADEYATRLGLHPANVWTDWYQILDELGVNHGAAA